MPMQFRPAIPPQQPPPYISVASQQFIPVGGTNTGMPSVSPQVQYPQPMVQQPMPGQGHVMPLPPPIPVLDAQPNRPVISVSSQPQQTLQAPNGYMAGLAGPRMPISATYTISVPSTGQLQINGDKTGQYQLAPQTNAPSFPAGEQAWLSGSENVQPVTSVLQSVENFSHAAAVPATAANHTTAEDTSSEWIEHTRNGRRFYYSKKT